MSDEVIAANALERVFNRLFGFLVGPGLGVRGRKSGRPRSTPGNVLSRKPTIPRREECRVHAYLDRFALTVRRYFPVAPGSPAESFRPLVARYPAFELLPRR